MSGTDLRADRLDRLAGTLLGTALGDALGLPAEGMSAPSIARRFGRLDRFRLLGPTGFVSDDTEQSALIAQSLARHPDDPSACARAFRKSMLGWACRLPWGVGFATLRACVRIGFGIEPSGVMSAGNGSAMRSSIIGAFLADRPDDRITFGRALAEVTHRDPRAVEGSLYVAEMAAWCVQSPSDADPIEIQTRARRVVTDPELGRAIDLAVDLAKAGAPIAEAAVVCGTSGFVVQTLGFVTFAFLRTAGFEPTQALAETIALGGDTDSIAAILGGWLGARSGESGLPDPLLRQIHDGPFGPTHLRGLAKALALAGADAKPGQPATVPGYSTASALARNLALTPVILAHGFRRLIP